MTGTKPGFWSELLYIIDFSRQAESRINGHSLCEPEIQSPQYIITVTQIELKPLYKLQLASSYQYFITIINGTTQHLEVHIYVPDLLLN